MDAKFIAFWTRGSWTLEPTFPITHVTQDSRLATVGALYVALKGENHDGHDFIQSAFDTGATAAVVSENWHIPESLASLPLLRVADPAQALLDFATAWRNSLKTTVVGVTGSAGKTTVKELTAAMLSAKGKTQFTPGNYNNAVGLPLTLLLLDRDAQFAVIEAGISHPYDMYPLAHAMKPQAVIISSIGPAHIAFFGNEEAIAAEKGQLLQALPSDGFAVIPKETHCFDVLKEMCPARVVTVSITDQSADYYAEPIALGIQRVYHLDEPAILLESGLPGAYNAANVLCAYAMVRELGLSADEAIAGLKTFEPPKMRWQQLTVNGVNYINDAYNANPLSVEAALESFAGLTAIDNKVLCLGDMLELGEDAEQRHAILGAKVGNGPWRLLIGVGPLMKAFIASAIAAGYPENQTCWFESTEAAMQEAPLLIHPADTVLLKGSRGIALEKLIPQRTL